jgi:hypothetical protein
MTFLDAILCHPDLAYLPYIVFVEPAGSPFFRAWAYL